MGDPARFTGRRGVGSWLGLTPKSHESGEAGDRKGHISRLGPGRVRKVLNQVALVRLRCHGPTRAWMQHQTEHLHKGKKKMIVALMRRIGIQLWHRAIEACA
jgi:transposase